MSKETHLLSLLFHRIPHADISNLVYGWLFSGVKVTALLLVTGMSLIDARVCKSKRQTFDDGRPDAQKSFLLCTRRHCQRSPFY